MNTRISPQIPRATWSQLLGQRILFWMASDSLLLAGESLHLGPDDVLVCTEPGTGVPYMQIVDVSGGWIDLPDDLEASPRRLMLQMAEDLLDMDRLLVEEASRD